MVTDDARLAALAARQARQAEHDDLVGPRIDELRAEGLQWRALARALDAEDVPTPTGRGPWHPQQAQRICWRRHPHLKPPPGPPRPRRPKPDPDATRPRRLWRALRRLLGWG